MYWKYTVPRKPQKNEPVDTDINPFVKFEIFINLRIVKCLQVGFIISNNIFG